MLDNVSSQGLTSISQSRGSAGGNSATPVTKPIPQTVKPQETSERLEVEMPVETMKNMVEGLNHFLKPTNSSIKYEFHDQLNEYYITLVDNTTSEIIREIPSKKMLDLYAAMTEKIGLFVDKKI